MRTRLTLLLAVAALAGCAEVPTNTAALAPKTDTPPSEQDVAWLRTIHQGDIAEIQAGRLAQGKGSTKRIKAIGRMLVQDHTKFDVKVSQVATQLGVQLPRSISAHQREEILQLRDAVGRDFDQEFIATMTNEHLAAIAATKKEISGGSSQPVVALAKAAAPTLEQHLAELRGFHGE
ncbi:DUF4142 domain-containing protein [Nonomuraea turkmeniaca]|uniref:DUF4142 domain-containing protein n=1 Tax=Nonomuraea turkmeniaca TaxID=103838 RepID=A0A5S4FSV1_9ACTN|nr:DUF4142 domain-containing protein [Nonomuraea turkmeniaca]TMR23845.1 DUF4142 domain-containing protein [Nonomuraea turkmeniaca]